MIHSVVAVLLPVPLLALPLLRVVPDDRPPAGGGRRRVPTLDPLAVLLLRAVLVEVRLLLLLPAEINGAIALKDTIFSQP